MPYIPPNKRNIVKGNFLYEMRLQCPDNVGELNFIISTIIENYLGIGGLSYENINSVIGVLECVKLELYRRVVAPYEDKRRHENGDVYYFDA